MSSAAVVDVTGPAVGAPAADAADAFRLARAIAKVAVRLADTLEGAPAPSAAGPLAEAASFLRSMAANAFAVLGDAELPLPEPLLRLGAGLGLTPLELDLVVLACMPDEHEGYASVLRAVSPRGEPRPTLGVAAQLFCTSARERLALRRVVDEGAAFQSGLLFAAPADAPLFDRALLLADGVAQLAAGCSSWPVVARRLAVTPVLAGLSGWLAEPPVVRARAALASGARRSIVVTAMTDEAALARAAALATAARIPWVALALPAGAARAEAEKLVALHCLARGVTPILTLPPPETGTGVEAPALPALPGPVVVAARAGAVVARDGRPVLHVDAPRLSVPARAQAWAALLPGGAAVAHVLAARYAVEPAAAALVSADLASDGAGTGAGDDARTLLERVADSVRVRAHHGLAAGVRLVRPSASFADLVVSPEQQAQLMEALARMQHQGRVIDEWGFLARQRGARGLRILFAGPPGTGKTLSAEVLAGELGTDLLIVDIARVVSKWIGETEKHLAEVFDAAERTQAVLLFDEADALFGKRTEVSDAHDRYANLETAYLLSRLESFEGLAVLATNLRQNIDSAFIRRLEFVVDFSEPTAPQREALWRVHLPATAPIARDLDLAEVATRFAVVGASIRNAAVAAAFLAAAERSPISRAHVMRAIRREYAKAGKAFPSDLHGSI